MIVFSPQTLKSTNFFAGLSRLRRESIKTTLEDLRLVGATAMEEWSFWAKMFMGENIHFARTKVMICFFLKMFHIWR